MFKPYIISHRGNTKGSDVYRDNNPKIIQELLDNNIDVEVDVWIINNVFYLGHDMPIYKVNKFFLENPLLWCHAKNTAALNKMIDNEHIDCFWHEKDKHTLTSRGYIWQEGYHNLTDKTIVVDLSKNPDYNAKCYGICVNYLN